MSIHDLITPRHAAPPAVHDDDIQSLLERADLADFRYRNINQHERQVSHQARWPLLTELAAPARGSRA